MFSRFSKSEIEAKNSTDDRTPEPNPVPEPANFSEHTPNPIAGVDAVAPASDVAPDTAGAVYGDPASNVAPDVKTFAAPEANPLISGEAKTFVGEEMSAPPKSVGDVAASVMGSKHFAKFVDGIADFLDITDIADPGHRRAAIVSRKLNEDSIKAKLTLAHGFFNLQSKFAMSNGMPELVDSSELYLGKIETMKAQLGI